MNNLLGDDIIEEFSGDYRFLSNFYSSPFEFYFTGRSEEIHIFKTVEHFYQAMKVCLVDQKMFHEIISCNSPGRVKRLGRKVEMPKSEIIIWDAMKVSIMGQGIKYKFQDPVLRELLLSTGDIYIQEGNNWGDTFWGVDLKTGLGKNILGQLLMKERKELLYK